MSNTITNRDRARREAEAAYALDEAVEAANQRHDWRKAGRIQATQRMHMKRAEVAALMHIGEELARIGLTR
jgi:hypothetical protein